MPKTLFKKIWDTHLVDVGGADMPAILYIDLHLVHEVTSPQAFTELRTRGIKVHRPAQTLATMDHSTPTTARGADGKIAITDAMAAAQLQQMAANCRDFGIPLYDMDSAHRGVVHVMGPELGATQPGMTIVCGDSHTSTHGAFGALAFGIGTSEVGHVLSTQCLLQWPPKTFEVRFEGQAPPGVTAKDMILALIAKIGVGGGTGYVIEYTGEAVRALDMEARMTLCNMSIEAGARAGLVAPDDTTFEYLAGRPFAPSGADWDAAITAWRRLPTDAGARYDHRVSIDARTLEPMVTYGTNPGMGIGVGSRIPDPAAVTDLSQRRALEKALAYMGLQAGQPIAGQPIDVVFLGSCTNGRISDLRAAASVLRGRKVDASVRMLVVPGSEAVKRQAEAEGLDHVFKDAGAEWREPGCSMCIAMNGDHLEPGQYAVSTSNRNFEGRQGPGGRTFLASPLTAAASAIAGKVADPREVLP